MAELTPEQIIEGQQRDWNRVAGGWEKWDAFFDRQMAFLNHRIVGDARIHHGMHVLDLGSGTGHPALLAAQTVGPSGTVVGIDLAQQMLDVAERKAKRLGLSNVTFRTGDITMLPFAPASFDAVTSRFCLMFLPDVPQALREIARVLKPGAWVAAAVWAAAEKNISFSITINVLKQFLEIPPPDPKAPGLFRLAGPGELAGMFEQAGLVALMEQEFQAEWSYASPEEYYTSVVELAAPIQNLVLKLSAGQQARVKSLVIEAASRFQRNGPVTFPITVRMVAGRKPT
ncbi:MAG TPA: class I SAM-dependent methyltransferase [Nitrospira sp.]|nr:class I SAM-dependent methyltransferase [Nitrospira sp.]